MTPKTISGKGGGKMRTKCANCGMIYDIPITGMDMRTPLEVSQSGVCPSCKSNVHNPIQPKYKTTFNKNE